MLRNLCLWSIVASLVILPWARFSYAAETDHSILIVSTGLSEHTQRFVSELKSTVSNARVEVMDLAAFNAIPQRNLQDTKSLVIGVGPSVLAHLLEDSRRFSLLSVYTTQPVYDALIQRRQRNQVASAAIFADPSIEEQLNLVRGLYGTDATVGIVTSEDMAVLVTEVKRLGMSIGVHPVFESIEQGQVKALERLRRRQVDVVLAMPDFRIFNPNKPAIIKSFLMTTYRNGQGVVGFSSALVRIGALASVFYQPKHVAKEVSDVITRFQLTGNLPISKRPGNFNVAINKTMAKSLELYRHDPADLLAKIKANTSFADESLELVFYEPEYDSLM